MSKKYYPSGYQIINIGSLVDGTDISLDNIAELEDSGLNLDALKQLLELREEVAKTNEFKKPILLGYVDDDNFPAIAFPSVSYESGPLVIIISRGTVIIRIAIDGETITVDYISIE